MDNICDICIIDHRVAIATWNGRLCIVDTSKIPNTSTFGLDLRGLPRLNILWETNFPEPAVYSPFFTTDNSPGMEESVITAHNAEQTKLMGSSYSFKHNRRITKMVYASGWHALFIANVAGELYQLNLSTYKIQRLGDRSFRNVFLRINDLALSSDENYLYFVNRNNLWCYDIRNNKFSILYPRLGDSPAGLLLTCRTYLNGVAAVTKQGYCFFFMPGKEMIRLYQQPPQSEREKLFQLQVLVMQEGKKEPVEDHVPYTTPHPYPLCLDSCDDYIAFSFFSGETIESIFVKKSTIVIFDRNFHQNSFNIPHIVQKLLYIKKGKLLLILTEEGELFVYDRLTQQVTDYKKQIAHCDYNADLNKLITISTVDPNTHTQTITNVFATPPAVISVIALITEKINGLSSPVIDKATIAALLKSVEVHSTDGEFCQSTLNTVQKALETDTTIAATTAGILAKIDELKELLYKSRYTQPL